MITGAAQTRTTCPYCGVGCGLVVDRAADGGIAVRGDPEHPANAGRVCAKGSALAETMGLGDRLLYPQVHGKRVGWVEALDLVSGKFTETIERHGPESVAFYLSGQLLTEDYYVANKLMKGFIGAANLDTNSRLCMASSVAGHKRAFGSDTVPGVYADLDHADLVVLVGSNLAWCHPVLFQRLEGAKQARPELKIVVIDPRRTVTAHAADLHLPVAPGADVALFNGLLAHLDAAGAEDPAFVDMRTRGIEAALAAAHGLDLAAVAAIAGIAAGQLKSFYELFARTRRVVTVYSQGVNQSTSGTDKVNAIINCHLFTGRIGRPGMGPFSVTGQPNAMGGREVGGLANQLAAHMELENPEHRRIVGEFWRAPHLAERPGLKAVEMFEAVRAGSIKALWIAATNPVDSLPQADAVRAALQACPFVVVSDVEARTDTTVHAHVLLPAAAWGEKDGTVTNSERRISRQRAFMPLPGEARPDWWIFSQVGHRMGWPQAFAFHHPSEIFAEHAALSGRENRGRRDFDISAYADCGRGAYDRLSPFQWPAPAGGGRPLGDRRFFADGDFFTPDRRARFVATPYRRPASIANSRHPLILNTGRVRDQWHTMTRSGKSPRLMSHIAEPYCEMHPLDAAARGIATATIVEIESEAGRMLARAAINADQRPGSVFVPMHWTGQFAGTARVDALVSPNADPLSGQPELKHTPVEVRGFGAAWYGFAVLAARPVAVPAAYWALAPAKSGWRLEMADTQRPGDWAGFARAVLGADGTVELLAYHDATANRHRFAAFRDGALIGALFVAGEPVEVSRAWLAAQLATTPIAPSERLRLLAGRAGGTREDGGAIICSCFDIGVTQIARAVTTGNCATIEDIGVALQAGTNCGSCRSELRKIIDAALVQKAG